MATPAAGMGLTATQQSIVNAAIAKSVAGVGSGETNAQIQSNFASYLGQASNNVAGSPVAPSGLDFTTGANPNPDFLGGSTATTQMIDAAFNTVSNNGHNSSFYEQGNPSVFASSWIAQVDALFNPVSSQATSPVVAQAPAATPAPVATNPIAAAPLPVAGTTTAPSNPTAAPIGSGTAAMPAPNPNPDVTGDVNTTTATTATTGQNLASADPGTVLGQLLAAISNSGAGAGSGTSGSVSIPPSAIVPTDTSGGATSGTTTGTSSPSMTDMIVIGVIASLIAAAIWYFAIKHGSIKGLEKELHV